MSFYTSISFKLYDLMSVLHRMIFDGNLFVREWHERSGVKALIKDKGIMS